MSWEEVVGEAVPRQDHREPYSTLAVILVALGLLGVPVLTYLANGRWAVLWLATEVAILAAVRMLRFEGTWIAARGRRFDVVFGALLALSLVVLSSYALLPRPL